MCSQRASDAVGRLLCELLYWLPIAGDEPIQPLDEFGNHPDQRLCVSRFVAVGRVLDVVSNAHGVLGDFREVVGLDWRQLLGTWAFR